MTLPCEGADGCLLGRGGPDRGLPPLPLPPTRIEANPGVVALSAPTSVPSDVRGGFCDHWAASCTTAFQLDCSGLRWARRRDFLIDGRKPLKSLTTRARRLPDPTIVNNSSRCTRCWFL
ncbi:hypothetical protein E4T56_gene13501 [Termitomyces sp. T112]|nr:hypothetical protein E4T56_gene13501 [Termitomyces sp. T112]